MFNSILVVCAGNICRSPTGEFVLKRLFAGKNVKISSAGLTALVGKPADSTAIEIAKQNDVDISSHEGRQLNSRLISENDLLLVMEHKHLDDLCGKYPHARGKTFLLGKWLGDAEIPDPYRQSTEAFFHVFKLIEKACHEWQKYI